MQSHVYLLFSMLIAFESSCRKDTQGARSDAAKGSSPAAADEKAESGKEGDDQGEPPEKLTPKECSEIAENFVKVTGTPVGKTLAYEKCKEATGADAVKYYRCIGDADDLAELDECKPLKPVSPEAMSVEARTTLPKLFDPMVEYYSKEHPAPGLPPHRCPHPAKDPANASSGIVPPLSVRCSLGPAKRCVPTDSPKEPWEYPKSMWRDNEVFAAIGFALDEPHRLHYAVKGENKLDDSYGVCMFTAQAFGDLDNDGVFSTFERAAMGASSSVRAAPGLYIDRETE